eukprot:CAMPEP_0115834974 /NCGR_PEP_ID=MMETSP0287-20121206/3960_1 /TAXON_ID=412157 /ORGANISM="Chrysochromulina rotalis, Strain UIO044" /LENGTH=100 /DNA_ID=CAMNT_0003288427 /DNA_START=1 /DNA_END=303 /DNA_ORIENTATION=-
MAALELEPGAPPPELRRLYAALDEQLPPYAHPRFVRLMRADESIETTLTFKPKKATLQREGFDPAVVGAEVFLRDAVVRSFVPLSTGVHAALVRGEQPLD